VEGAGAPAGIAAGLELSTGARALGMDAALDPLADPAGQRHATRGLVIGTPQAREPLVQGHREPGRHDAAVLVELVH
jgi:hypothetical protein